jgi:hypothetical protein
MATLLSLRLPFSSTKPMGLLKLSGYRCLAGEEVTLSNKTRARLEDMSADFSYLTGGALMDQEATALARPDATYRDLAARRIFPF